MPVAQRGNPARASRRDGPEDASGGVRPKDLPVDRGTLGGGVRPALDRCAKQRRRFTRNSDDLWYSALLYHRYKISAMKPTMKPADLRQARRVRKLSQRELAEAFGVASNSVARWEQGVRPIPDWVGRMLALMTRLDIVEHELAREIKKGGAKK